MTKPGSQPRLRCGDVVFIGRAASVQFAGGNSFHFRIIRVHEWDTYHGWVWLDGYQLDHAGAAVERRTIFVLLAGLDPTPQPPARQPSTRR